jgi:Tfp pilus assembly protein PilF
MIMRTQAVVLVIAAMLISGTAVASGQYASDNPEVKKLLAQGKKAFDGGNVDEAIDNYRKALEIKPDYAEAHDKLGLALAERGQIDEAIAHFRKALEIKPDFTEAHNDLGLALIKCGRVEEAIAQYRRALEIKPDFAEAHINLGSALAARGRADEAIAKHNIATRQTTHPYVTLTGTDSHVKEPSYRRAMSEDEWIKIWQRHKGEKESKDYDLFYNPLGLPSIDFEKCMVIAVFQGSGVNSAGLKAVAILEEKDRIVLRFQDKSYQTAGPDGGGEQVTVYGFFVLPRSSKTVVLEENVQNGMHQPPVWKERVGLTK